MDRSKSGHLRVADRPADYERLGIDPVEVAQFEDGQRIGTERGRYEWWYFDAHLDDGATVVVVFYTKPNVSPNRPLAPRITINLTLPDGRDFVKFLDTGPELFNASKSGCDVRIGTNRFVGDLDRYHITATIEEISVDIELTGDVRAWRPKSGHLYFGAEGQEKLFAWLPAVPHGLACVRYSIGNEEHRASGSGYHDHNWGDVPMQTLMHDWYWARASVGPYTIIASYITATAAYGYETQIVYMLAKDGKIIAVVEAFAAEHGLHIVGTYTVNESGAKLARPELFRLIADSRPGDVLLIEQVDRLSRLNDTDWRKLRAELDSREMVFCGLRAGGHWVGCTRRLKEPGRGLLGTCLPMRHMTAASLRHANSTLRVASLGIRARFVV
jgi:Resolvase, N terminal domain